MTSHSYISVHCFTWAWGCKKGVNRTQDTVVNENSLQVVSFRFRWKKVEVALDAVVMWLGWLLSLLCWPGQVGCSVVANSPLSQVVNKHRSVDLVDILPAAIQTASLWSVGFLLTLGTGLVGVTLCRGMYSLLRCHQPEPVTCFYPQDRDAGEVQSCLLHVLFALMLAHSIHIAGTPKCMCTPSFEGDTVL